MLHILRISFFVETRKFVTISKIAGLIDNRLSILTSVIFSFNVHVDIKLPTGTGVFFASNKGPYVGSYSAHIQ